MESYSETFVGNSKVTFYGVVSTYPSVSFYFSFPAQYKPESGDWIALYPVGWSNLVGDFVVKKMVKPERLWNGIYGGDKWIGNMEFEMADWVQSVPSYSPIMTSKFAKDQYYQLVYVKNGDLVLGASKPFSLYTSDMFSGYSSYKPTYAIDGAEATGCLVSSFPLTSEFSIEPQTEKQLQQLISNVYNIEQSIGGWYKTPQTSYNGVETYFKNSFGELYSKFGPTESLVDQVVLPHQIHKYWMTRLGEMEQMMMEQFKIEQAQRRIDQTYILAQLKTYERYVFYMMKNEQAINEYMRGAKLAAKLAEFEKKCYEIVKTYSLVEQPEYYVQKYEQLLKEKIELEILERAKYLPKLRQLVKECLEFKLKEIQSMEHQYYTRFYKLIKTKLGMWESKYYQPIVGQFIGAKLDQAFLYEEKMDYELRQQLKYLIGQFYTEQAKELYQLVKLNKQISWLCGEISSKLYQYEWTYGGDMYAQIKLAPKLKPIMYISSVLYPFYTSLVGLPINTESEETYFEGEYEPIKKLVQLEQTLFQLRGTLKYSLFSGYQDKYPVGYEMWSPIEYYLQSGCHSVWKHLQMLERKLVFLKGIWLEKQLKSYLMQRLTDYEVVPTITTKFGDKIKYIKSVFSKHYQLPTYEAYWPAQGHYLFTTPESFVQHHEQFDKLWTLFNEFEFGTIWGEQTGLNSYYGPSFSKDLDYPFFNPIGKQYFGSNYSTYRYPTSYVTSKYEAYPYGEFYGNESFKPYKPYLSRSSVFSTSYVPLSSASKVFGGVSNPIDTVIGELESELTKMKVQKEMAYEFPTTFPSSVYPSSPVGSYIPSSASSFF